MITDERSVRTCMILKKLIPVLLCCTMLAGCAGKPPADDTPSETVTPTEAPTEETAAPTEAPTDAEPSDPKAELLKRRAEDPECSIHFSFVKEREVIGVYYNKSRISEIKPDCIPDDDTVMKVMDYDIDNIDDVYISGETRPVRLTPGDYWVCDPETFEFHKSEELAFYYGRGLEAATGGRSLEIKYEEPSGSSRKTECTLIIAWDADRVIPLALKKKMTVYGDPVSYYEDCYEFDENGDMLLLRHSVLDARGEKIVDSFEDTPYIRVTDNGVECMKRSEVVQTIPAENLSSIAAALHGMPEDKKVLSPFVSGWTVLQEDYDFDGYDDLRITTGTDEAGEGNSFAFYRYEPSTGLYQEWPELNALPAAPFTDWRNSSLFFDIPEYDDNVLRDNTYVYVWDKGKLKPDLRRESVTIFAENDGIYHTMYYVYKYDENGNEYQYDMFSEPKTVGG